MKSLPQTFLARLQEIHQNEFESILSAFSSKRKGSFRVNFLKSSEEKVLEEMQQKNISLEKFPLGEGIFLFDKNDEYSLKGTKSFYEGDIYLQSISSMLPVFALNPQSGEKILDVCSAPGSKTTQMAMLQKNIGNIVALEKNQIRFDKLNYNIRLQNAQNILTHKIDALKFLGQNSESFDKILLDVPCSAEGRIWLGNEKTFGFWSEENILQKAKLQTELLEASWKHLKKGGILVYSTCTLAPEENEYVVSRFLKNHDEAEILPIEIGCEGFDFYQKNIEKFRQYNFENLHNCAIRILPSLLTDGFFLAKIQKK